MCLHGFTQLPLDNYLEKTASLRDRETNLLIVTIKPHKKVHKKVSV